MKHFKIQQLGRIFFASASFFALAGIGSCSMSMQEFCAHKLPEMDQCLSLAASSLDGSLNGGAARGLAAVSTGDATRAGAREVDLSPVGESLDPEEERELWMKWAEDRLSETQQYMDAIEGLPGHAPVRRELSGIATELVSFHGYTRQSKRERMIRSIGKVRARLAKARGLACESAQVAAGTK